jgi:hypothetical protein
MSLREAIDLGMLAPVQVWHYKTDIKLNVPMRTGDFSERELQSLIENEARNRAAVDLATNYVSQGLQGIVACVPGNKTRHATEMAEQLSKAEITDKDGVTRKVIARSVSGNTPTEELDAIYAGYRNGSIDVLTYVDLLTEGWDAPSAKFLINLRPTKSPVNAVQRLGRVLRLYEPESVAQIVEFVDDIKGADSYNALHALGEVDAPLNSGEVYGGRSNVVTKEGVEDETELFIPDLERVRALIETCELELLSDLYLSPLEKKHRQDIEQGDLLTMQDALERIERMGGQVSATAFRNALEEVVYIGDKPYVSTEELDRVKGRYIPNEGDMRSGDINKEIGDRLEQKGLRDVSIHRAPVQTLFEYFDRTAREFKAPGAKHVGTVWDREEVEEVLSRVMEDFEEGEYETIFDYFHDDNGTRVRYDKVRFTRIEQMARGAVERRLDMMSYEQRLEALRLVVKPLYGEPNLNLAFRKDILATLSGSKNVYLRK